MVILIKTVCSSRLKKFCLLGLRRAIRSLALIAHMEWALEDFPGVNDLVEYETRANFILPKYKDPVI